MWLTKVYPELSFLSSNAERRAAIIPAIGTLGPRQIPHRLTIGSFQIKLAVGTCDARHEVLGRESKFLTVLR